jgi:parallel beta-helix repeat protein
LGVAFSGVNNHIEGVVASYNNTRGFNKWWEAGGFKFVGNGGLIDSEFVRNTAFGNLGDGIWFDWKNKNNIIRSNVSAYNSGFGIHYEVSRSGIIQDNIIYGNGQRGIYLPDSSNCWVTHNLVISNGLEGIAAVYTGRKDNLGVAFGAEDNKMFSNIIGWNKGLALIMPKGAKNIGISDGNVFLDNQKIRLGLGYPSALSPETSSLSEWIALSQLDKNSVASQGAIPKSIAYAIVKQQPVKDWAEILKLAKLANGTKSTFNPLETLPGGQVNVLGPRNLN